MNQERTMENEVQELFAYAERQIKMTEGVEGDLVIPAVNQLRYAGHHLSQALTTTDQEVKTRELQEAKLHCRRAVHDAVEVRAIYLLERFRSFLDRYRGVTIASEMPRYPELLKQAEEVRKVLAGEEGQSQDEHDRNERLTQLVDDFMANMNVLDQTTFNLNARLARMRSKLLRWTLGIVAGLCIGIITTLYISIARPPVTEHPEIMQRVKTLENIQVSLETLIGFVSQQKGQLEQLEVDIADLEREKKTLDDIVAMREGAVDAMLNRVAEKSRRTDITLSFIIGFLSSLAVTVVVAATTKWRELNKRIQHIS